MPSINNVLLIGHLARDPEVQYSTGGTAIARFSVACNRFNKDKDKQTCDFIPCVAWKTTAEYAGKSLHKGDLVCIEGSIAVSQYEKDGQKRTKIEVNVSRLHSLSFKKKANDDSAPASEDVEDMPF